MSKNVRLRAPKNITGFSFDGKSYDVKKGFILVPAEAEPVAREHGFGDADQDGIADGDEKDDQQTDAGQQQQLPQ